MENEALGNVTDEQMKRARSLSIYISQAQKYNTETNAYVNVEPAQWRVSISKSETKNGVTNSTSISETADSFEAAEAKVAEFLKS